MTTISTMTLRDWIGAAVIMLLALSTFLYSGFEISNIITKTLNEEDLIKINSGSLRLFGAGLGALLLFAYMLTKYIGYLEEKKNLERAFKIGLIFSAVVFLLMPPLFHLTLEKHLFQKGYDVCESKSYSKRTYTVTTYTSNSFSCVDAAGSR